MWVLLETKQTRDQGKSIYFKGWSGTEPVTTDDVSEAEQFISRVQAVISPAFRHWQSSFVPVEVDLAAAKNRAA